MNTYDIPKSDWSETVRKRMVYATRRGVPTGPVPLGYRKVRRHGLTFVDIDPGVAPLIREAFWLASLRRQTLRSIVADLNGSGLRSQRGTPLSPMALWRVLTNPFYCGTIRFAGEEVEGIHEQIVTREEFDRVQKVRAGRRRQPVSRGNNTAYKKVEIG